MRSDAIDELLSNYFKMPAKVSWDGALADSVRGVFEGARLELAGLAILALPFDRLVFQTDRFQFTPGIPARIEAIRPTIEVSIDQRQIDRWLQRAWVPFELRLNEDAIEFRMSVGGFFLTRTKTEIGIQRGWFVLRPKHVEVFGVRARLVSVFRTYLPLPRLAPQTRLTGIRHVEGGLRFELSLDDFADVITPGLIERLQNRFLPFAKQVR
jgi:hypothetical protein